MKTMKFHVLAFICLVFSSAFFEKIVFCEENNLKQSIAIAIKDLGAIRSQASDKESAAEEIHALSQKKYQTLEFKLEEFNLNHVQVTVENERFIVVQAEKKEVTVICDDQKTYTTKRSRMSERLKQGYAQNQILISRIRAYWFDGILRIVIPILD